MNRSNLNPLSTWTYHRRHWQRTMLLFGVISLATTGLYLIFALALIMSVGPISLDNHYLQNFSLVRPQGDNEQVAATVAQIRAQPNIAEVISISDLRIGVNLLGGGVSYETPLLGVQEADIATVMAASRVTLKTGRLIQPRTNEFMLSEELATNLGLRVGDQIDHTINEDNYFGIREPLTLVGLLEGDTYLGIVSYEYLAGHELYGTSNWFLVIAQPGHSERVQDFLVSIIGNDRNRADTLQLLLAERASNIRMTAAILLPIALLIAMVVTVVSAVINRMEVMRRLAEFGILSVVGYSKGWLTRRLAAENASLAISGWALGIGLPWLLLAILERFVFTPRGYAFQSFQWAALLLTTPIPIAILLFVIWRVARTFARMDGIAVIEHGELELETKQQPARKVSNDSTLTPSQPLSSFTFYQRHRRRAALLIGAMALMIMAVVVLIFSMTTGQDALIVSIGDKTRMSVLDVINQRAASGITAQVRTHPAVERVIPFVGFHLLTMNVPPWSQVGSPVYAVSEEDMAYLVNLYGLQIKEGRLPRPRTNEVIIAEATAANRQLKVSDIFSGDDEIKLPTPLQISGIFARDANKAEENWFAFASLEFIQSHERFAAYPSSLIIVPKPGQKATLDDWLEQNASGGQVIIWTYRQEFARLQQQQRNIILTIALLEGVVALVAAITLAVLNYIFLTQRQTEFGVLNALGYGRRWLMWRTLRETLFTTAAAWGLSVLLCVSALLYMQWGIYQPLGIPLSYGNPVPWLFTLPVPLAVLAASAISIRQMLYRLDTVAVIERN